MNKNKVNPLIKFSFKFFGTTPNVYEINELGRGVSNPHKEVSKIKQDGSRWFETAIKKPGRYKFLNFNLTKEDSNYLLLQGKNSGIFQLDETGQIQIIEWLDFWLFKILQQCIEKYSLVKQQLVC